MDQEIKKEFEDLAKIIKTSFEDLEGKIVTKADFESGMAQLENRLTGIQSELEAIRLKLEVLEKRAKEDTGVLVKDVLELRDRLGTLEKQVKQLQISHGKI